MNIGSLKSLIVSSIVIFSPNIFFFILGFFFTIPRPYFVYDYFLLFALLYFNTNFCLIWLAFSFVLLVDLTYIGSSLYLFSIEGFIDSLRFIGNFEFNDFHFYLLASLVFFLFLIFQLLKSNRELKNYSKEITTLIMLLIGTIFCIDFINGSTFLPISIKPNSITKRNFAGSNLILAYHNFNNIIQFNNIEPPIALEKQSVTYKSFKTDTIGNQLLIIVESFGLISDNTLKNKFFHEITTNFKKNGWSATMGETTFNGSTTNSELRELLNLKGDYRYFIQSLNSKKHNSIFKIKSDQGYKTIGIHSYKGQMFERNLWWKNIGIENCYYMENLLSASNYKMSLNEDTPFTSCFDEDAFKFLQSKVTNKQKFFAYMLTVNTHLPFTGIKITHSSNYYNLIRKELSVEAINQLFRIEAFLGYLAKNLDKSKWSKVLIVGDHMPPYVRKTDRDFYSDHRVPYLLIEQE